MEGSSNLLTHKDRIEALEKNIDSIIEKLDRLIIDKNSKGRRSEDKSRSRHHSVAGSHTGSAIMGPRQEDARPRLNQRLGGRIEGRGIASDGLIMLKNSQLVLTGLYTERFLQA